MRKKKFTLYLHLKTSSISRHLLARLANKTCITQASQAQMRREANRTSFRPGLNKIKFTMRRPTSLLTTTSQVLQAWMFHIPDVFFGIAEFK